MPPIWPAPRTCSAQQSTPGIRSCTSRPCGTVPVPDRSGHRRAPVVGAENGYGQTKAACERYARSLQDAGHPVVTIYPSGIVGPEDWNESINLNSVKLWIEKGFVAKGYSGSYVDVRDSLT